jgi:hypothetical protein
MDHDHPEGLLEEIADIDDEVEDDQDLPVSCEISARSTR